ncbi:MAG: DUF4143 domain-containing protein, partial [Acholeplasma sp.]|nr:DUF4143 domain-containing protein [Acholeplasma sp.]
ASEEIKSVDGKERDKTKVLELMKSLARNTATSAADTTILEDIKSNITSMHINTVNEYLKDLRELYVIEDLPAWTPKIRSKTAVRTKYVRHFSDPALAAALLNAGPNDLINDINTFGFLFESLVIRDLRIYAQRINGEVYHYRDSSNLEVDAIIHLSDGRWGAAEIKLGAGQIDEAAINLQKLKNKVDLKKKPSFLMVITGTEYAYKREDDVYVIPIGVLRD